MAIESGQVASREALVRRAGELAPAFAARALSTEQARRVPDESLRELHESGLLRLLQPARVGGLERDFGTFVEVTEELARGCASTAWVFANLASHHWMLGMWPAAAQDEVWGGGAGADAVIAASLAFPAGHARSEAGGYRMRGRWSFASGVDAAEWVMLGAVVDDSAEGLAGAPGEYRLFLLPRKDFGVHDNWYVSGLAGSGSKQVDVCDVLVPEHRSLALRHTQGGDTPGSAVNPGPLYRVPLLATFGYVVAGVPLGIAVGALDLFLGENGRRLASYSGRPLTDFSSVQVKVAEASANIHAARRILEADCADIMAMAADGGLPDAERKARLRRDVAFSARLAAGAVNLLFEASGGSVLYLEHPVQRAFRDVHAAVSHIALNWDAAANLYGRAAFGHVADMLPYER